MVATGTVRVGVSGWTYPPWRGVFYPDGLPHRRELAYASRALGGALEINGTHYRLQTPACFERWREEVPEGFSLAVKGSRFLTHMKKLNDPLVPLANLLASGVLRLGDRLGPMLWQLPPTFAYDEGRLDAFFRLLPRDTDAAAALARRHDQRVREPSTEPLAPGPIRHALEVRHPSFATPEAIALLRHHGIALVVADTAGRFPELVDVTADFVYVRLHGAKRLYVSGYTDADLDRWEPRVRAFAAGLSSPDGTRVGPAPDVRPRDVWIFFDNTDLKLRAPFDARALAARFGVLDEPEVRPPQERRIRRTRRLDTAGERRRADRPIRSTQGRRSDR